MWVREIGDRERGYEPHTWLGFWRFVSKAEL